MIQKIGQTQEAKTQEQTGRQQARLKEACVEFEAIMANTLLKSMRETIVRAEEPDQARQIFEGFFDETMAKNIAKQNRSSLSEALYKQLSPSLRGNIHK